MLNLTAEQFSNYEFVNYDAAKVSYFMQIKAPEPSKRARLLASLMDYTRRTSPMNDEKKPWQKGYDLAYLLSVEATYARLYNHRSQSPFTVVKKNSVADLLSKGSLHLSDDRDGKGSPAWAYDDSTSKAKTAIKLFSGTTIGVKQPGDRVLSRIAADWSDPAWMNQWSCMVEGASGAPVWVQLWAGDAVARGVVEKNARYVGCKVNTFGDVFSWYLLNGVGDTVRVSKVPPQHYARIRRFTMSTDFRDRVDAMRDAVLAAKMVFANHYSNYNMNGAWGALSLRGYSDDVTRIEKPSEMNDKWKGRHANEDFTLRDTALRSSLPQVEAILSAFPVSDWHRIRVMRLGPGNGELQRHTDQVDEDSGLGLGQLMRIHVPLKTNSKVAFTVWDPDDQPTIVNMEYGEAWMLDTRWPHMAINAGDEERLHLVIDAPTNPALLSMLGVDSEPLEVEQSSPSILDLL